MNLLLSLRGRASRRAYWGFFIATFVLAVFAGFADTALSGDSEDATPIFTLLFVLAIIWPSIAVAVKRWHDRDKSGWWVLINFVPLIGPIWALVENGFLAGTPQENRFGPPV